MIQLTRLNNHPLMVNSDLIKFVEESPDTVLSLVTGEKIVVLETPAQLIEKIVEFRRRILSGPALLASNAPSAADPTAVQSQIAGLEPPSAESREG
jgi:flagellar protein FlbD